MIVLYKFINKFKFNYLAHGFNTLQFKPRKLSLHIQKFFKFVIFTQTPSFLQSGVQFNGNKFVFLLIGKIKLFVKFVKFLFNINFSILLEVLNEDAVVIIFKKFCSLFNFIVVFGGNVILWFIIGLVIGIISGDSVKFKIASVLNLLTLLNDVSFDNNALNLKIYFYFKQKNIYII